MAQQWTDNRERYRVEPGVQRRLDVEPWREAVVLPLQRHLAGEFAITFAVDREGDADAVCIEKTGQELETTEQENDDRQRQMNGARNDQPAQWFRSQVTRIKTQIA